MRHSSRPEAAHGLPLNPIIAWYFVAVWGSGYVATKIGLHYAAPFTFLSLRFACGLLCLIPVVLLLKPKWPRTPVELGHLAVAGLLMHAMQLGGSHYAGPRHVGWRRDRNFNRPGISTQR